jgi:uncharacterized UBP type Zn finger protein
MLRMRLFCVAANQGKVAQSDELRYDHSRFPQPIAGSIPIWKGPSEMLKALNSFMARVRSGDLMRQLAWVGFKRSGGCTHLHQIRPLEELVPSAQGCEECIAMGDTWVHLRMCMTCGHVGCCDNSKNKHATKHYLTTDHPIARSMEPGEDWMWCYADRVLISSR